LASESSKLLICMEGTILISAPASLTANTNRIKAIVAAPIVGFYSGI